MLMARQWLKQAQALIILFRIYDFEYEMCVFNSLSGEGCGWMSAKEGRGLCVMHGG
jgi:hypothetical protein